MYEGKYEGKYLALGIFSGWSIAAGKIQWNTG